MKIPELVKDIEAISVYKRPEIRRERPGKKHGKNDVKTKSEDVVPVI